MLNKSHTITISILSVVLFLAGCGTPSTPVFHPTAIDSPTPVRIVTTQAPTKPSTPSPVPDTATPEPTATPTLPATPTELALETYIAYVQQDALVVTHVIGGQALETQKYINSQLRGGILKIVWAPSGEWIAFTMVVSSFPHTFVVKPQAGSEPIDLGISSDFSWSADSKMLAFEHEYELWVYSIGGGESRRLTTHLGTGWLWAAPAFSPDGGALVAAGTVTDEMDRHGHTIYKLYRVPLDGSAASAYPDTNMPAITDFVSGLLPVALHFSPDGQKLAVITSGYLENCAVSADYQVSNADGSEMRSLPVASLTALIGPDQDPYFFGDSLVWTAESDSVWVNGVVRDCTIAGNIKGGPQISRVTLDAEEHEVIPGEYSHLSLDRTGSLLGVVNRKGTPHVQILGRDGHLVIDLGEGELAALQP